MSDYDFTFDLSMTYTQADFDAITDEEFEKTTEVFLYDRKGNEKHFTEPKVGKWVEVRFKTIPTNRIAKAKKCSLCGKRKDKYATWNYCPNCGSKMERSE